MEKYQGVAIVAALCLMIGAALSETFLKVTWSPGLLALIGVPIGAMFAGKVADQIKKKAEDKATAELVSSDEKKKEG